MLWEWGLQMSQEPDSRGSTVEVILDHLSAEGTIPPHLPWGQGQGYGTAASSGPWGQASLRPYPVALTACGNQTLLLLILWLPFRSGIEVGTPSPITRTQRLWVGKHIFPATRENVLRLDLLGSPHWNHPWNVQNNWKAVFSWKHMENRLFAWRKIITCFFSPRGKLKLSHI